jgi:hypothetical protein
MDKRRIGAGEITLRVINVIAIVAGALGMTRVIHNQNEIIAALNARPVATAGVGGEPPLVDGSAERLGEHINPATPTPESANKTNRMAEWLAFWPDSPEKIAAMCGGNSADWKVNPDWSGNRTLPSAFGVSNYKPKEWQAANPESPSYDWPKTPQEAADYFFPGQNIDSRFMRKNDWGAWELMQDHWLFDGNADLTAHLHRCEVAEGYTVNGDDKPENDRAWVAFGGVGDSGILISAKGQGMTIWPPGVDPNKIALEWAPFTNTPYYRGPSGQQLGPDFINFEPIYDAPGHILSSRRFSTPSMASSPNNRPQLTKNFPFQKNVFRGLPQNRHF